MPVHNDTPESPSSQEPYFDEKDGPFAPGGTGPGGTGSHDTNDPNAAAMNENARRVDTSGPNGEPPASTSSDDPQGLVSSRGGTVEGGT